MSSLLCKIPTVHLLTLSSLPPSSVNVLLWFLNLQRSRLKIVYEIAGILPLFWHIFRQKIWFTNYKFTKCIAGHYKPIQIISNWTVFISMYSPRRVRVSTFATHLNHVHIRWAAGDRVVHFPHLPISFHGNHFDGHGDAATCEDGRVHHLCVLKRQLNRRKVSLRENKKTFNLEFLSCWCQLSKVTN